MCLLTKYMNTRMSVHIDDCTYATYNNHILTICITEEYL